ncbi:MAG: hypothetical protein K6B46_01700 [Opitutales bacterium]|nr:hypothetical protein [Opitutales bacterium]
MALAIRNPNWPEAEWDVSGAFSCDRELLLFHDFFSQVYGERLLSTVHGAPLCLWNSGRVLPKLICSPEQMRDAGLAYAKRGIPIDLTFSNHLIKGDALKDITCNALLKFVERNNPSEKNAVITASDELYEHIRKNYPRLKNVSSIVKVSVENGRGKLDYYRRLAERYDKVMIHPDDAWNYDLLEQLEDKSRYEILINEYCVRGCKIRPLHYQTLSNLSINYFGYANSKFEELFANNGCSNLNHLMTSEDRGTAACSIEEVKKLYEMGFRKFKLQGRGSMNAGVTIFDLLRIVLRDDPPDENVMQRIKLQFIEALSTLEPV